MKVPLSWLKEYLPLTQSPAEIANILTLAGLEVEKIETTPLSFEGVVVASVLSTAPHPNADKLKIATVFDGKEELQVVCGDPNCRPGLKVALARIGATLKDEAGKTWKIKKSKLRDVESFGMLCTAQELQLSSEGEGILEFSEDVKIGTDLASLYSDVIFEIGLTPNLGHCLSILGVARELSALLDIPLYAKELSFTEDASNSIEQMIDVLIEDKEKCLRYSCRLVKNVKVGPSPEWLKKRLEESGIRSINNLVDAGNYVMLSIGNPLHLFDYDSLAGKKIIVTSNHTAETLTTLDHISRRIPDQALVTSDLEKILDFAGIMGGESSAVSEETQNVLIEAAYFIPQTIRKTSKELGLRSEASHRFERGVDIQAIPYALDFAASLLQQVAGGQIIQGILDRKVSSLPLKRIDCRVARVNQLLGTHLSPGEIASIFKRLNISIVAENEERFTVSPPSYRHDLSSEIDLIEEVARVYGYNNLPKYPSRFPASNIEDTPLYLFEKEMRTSLIAEGLQECITCDLISPALAELSLEKTMGKDNLIHVLYPSSIDQSVLRPTLLPNLLQVVKLNQDHQTFDISAFEIGRIHFKDKDHYKEFSMAGVILAGKKTPYHWDPKPKEADFFDLKGIIENLMEEVGISSFVFHASHLHNFHPGRQARIEVDHKFVGVIGEVHPAHLRTLDIKQRVFFAELNLHDLYPLKQKQIQVRPLPSYPGSERDWTISLREEAPLQEVLQTIYTVRSRLLERVYLLDLYKSDQIGKHRKNVTLRFFYRDKEKTIAFDTVEQEHAKITQEVAEKLSDALI